MPLPKTFAELKAAGYRFDNHAKCRGCGADVEWLLTPKGGKMPFDLMPKDDSPAIAHFSTCPNAEEFRRAKVVR